MEFELHDVKFKYEDGNVYRWYEFKNIAHEWREIKIHFDTGYYNFSFSNKKKRYKIKIHRLIYWLHNQEWNLFDSSKDNCIDHINGNTRNNNIENLRVVTHQQNQWNRTRAKGYNWDKCSKKWKAQIQVNCIAKHIGLYENEEDARQAYLDAKEIYHII